MAAVASLFSMGLVGAAVVYTAVERIDATPDVVWEVLADFSAYGEWNPWLTTAVGACEVGAKVTATVVLGDQTRSAQHRVLEVAPLQRLCWRDAGWTTLFVKGRRCRIIEVEDGGVTLRNELKIWGPFVWLADKKYGDALLDGIKAETLAVRQRSEQDGR